MSPFPQKATARGEWGRLGLLSAERLENSVRYGEKAYGCRFSTILRRESEVEHRQVQLVDALERGRSDGEILDGERGRVECGDETPGQGFAA